MPTNALILSGGGARAAYQVGVLLALSDILPDLKNPFPIICGTSAGAINAAALAAHNGSFHQSSHDLANVWRRLEVDLVFKSGYRDVFSSVLLVLFSFLNDGVAKKRPLSLLDNSPLRQLLTDVINFENIQDKVDKGDLEALCITALGYSSGESVSFFQGNPYLRGWRRYRRVGTPAKIGVDHLMASSAIPAVFPTVHLSKEYFGDGAMRQMAPLSPALHLGADRLFIIGVSGNRHPETLRKKRLRTVKKSPSLGQILGQMFNSAFIDTLEGDVEHIERVNDLLLEIEDKKRPLRAVDTLIISPSKPLDKIAGRHIRNLPKSVKMILRSSGATAKSGGAAAASYLLFNHQYCSELLDLGYQDTMWERESVERFFSQSET